MGRLIDLTLAIPGPGEPKAAATLREMAITGESGTSYTGMIYDFAHGSMVGTYIDFPGHIKETDDGADADNYPLERLVGAGATVIHLDRPDESGAVTAEDLAAACPAEVAGGALVVNALGERRFDEIAQRSVYLSTDAVRWILDTGVHLLVSDIYESRALHGVFLDLFAGGVSTVCYPVSLHRLTAPRVKLSAVPVRIAGVTQLPCRVYAEMPDE